MNKEQKRNCIIAPVASAVTVMVFGFLTHSSTSAIIVSSVVAAIFAAGSYIYRVKKQEQNENNKRKA